MASISSADAELIGLWFQLLITGVYLAYLPQCVIILCGKRREGLRSLFLPFSCGLIFLITIADSAIAMTRSYSAFTVHGQSHPDPEDFYNNAATPICLAKNALEVAMSLVSDVIIVYRTFLLWNMNIYIILFPFCFLLANIGLGTWVMIAQGEVKATDPTTLIPVIMRIRYLIITTFCLNVFCAGMICWRIWRRSLANRLETWGTTRRVFETVMQTAAIHCAVLVIIITLDWLDLNMFSAFIDILLPLQALVFTVLIVRTNMHNNRFESAGVSRSLRWRRTVNTSLSESSSQVGRAQCSTQVEIDLERTIHTETDSTPHLYAPGTTFMMVTPGPERFKAAFEKSHN